MHNRPIALKRARLQPRPTTLADELAAAIQSAGGWLAAQQYEKGPWWFTLEANETIGSGYILITHYLDCVDPRIEGALARRILGAQRHDGTWAIYHDGPGDLSVTIECYFALKLARVAPEHPRMLKAKAAILKMGGITKARVFSWIHLALFGIVPWEVCPAMPLGLIQIPPWLPFNIYEFSSWARASIVPLLIVMDQKKTKLLPGGATFLDELFVERNPQMRQYRFQAADGRLSLGQFFILLDKIVKVIGQLPFKPTRASSRKKCEEWILSHQAATEDIYPAMAYALLALSALGYKVSDPALQKPLAGLKRFQQNCTTTLTGKIVPVDERAVAIHQQCCISPVWDTPWAGLSLVTSQHLAANHPQLIKAGRWLLAQQIRDCKGDWAIKNPNVSSGGWAFEFQNDYYPDVDDTIEVLTFLFKLSLPPHELREPFERGVNWLLSMQSKNGGWAAFDKDNTQNWVNLIPFSDHGACLDPPTPDITGRMLEFLSMIGLASSHQAIQHGRRFLLGHQENFGAWEGRWGVNYIYGTWAAVCGLLAIGEHPRSPYLVRAICWLKSIQRPDGGWSESCASYSTRSYIPLSVSIPSQTAWALITLARYEKKLTPEIKAGVQFLLKALGPDGQWSEQHHTGTGFPGHFFIRYHGYRAYFPLLALGEVKQLI